MHNSNALTAAMLAAQLFRPDAGELFNYDYMTVLDNKEARLAIARQALVVRAQPIERLAAVRALGYHPFGPAVGTTPRERRSKRRGRGNALGRSGTVRARAFMQHHLRQADRF